ncbi:MAG: hypothetical protein HY897_15330, partial [Deltaproteobacteria bacterium]|nr:hypothetical protein [Deltaproteobacteria bacterium]
MKHEPSAIRNLWSGFGRRFRSWVVSLKRLFTPAFWADVFRTIMAAMAAGWEAAPKSVFQHVALWMVFVCLVTFTGGPLNAQMV